jgi:hypothetical protein
MRNTEAHFGLTADPYADRISADGGETWLSLPLTDKEFQELVFDIEYWLDAELTEEELADLREICE